MKDKNEIFLRFTEFSPIPECPPPPAHCCCRNKDVEMLLKSSGPIEIVVCITFQHLHKIDLIINNSGNSSKSISVYYFTYGWDSQPYNLQRTENCTVPAPVANTTFLQGGGRGAKDQCWVLVFLRRCARSAENFLASLSKKFYEGKSKIFFSIHKSQIFRWFFCTSSVVLGYFGNYLAI